MSLIEYIYIDKSRLDGYFEQISDPVRYDKVPVWNASLGLTGPRAEASQTRQARSFTVHEKTQKLLHHLRQNKLLATERSPSLIRRMAFVCETCKAVPVVVPPQPGINKSSGNLRLWISPPSCASASALESPQPIEKQMLLCLLLDYARPDDDYLETLSSFSLWARIWSECQELFEESVLDYSFRRYERLSSPKSAEKVLQWLKIIGSEVGAERDVEALYRVRDIRQDFYEDGGPLFSVFGYPIYISHI